MTRDCEVHHPGVQHSALLAAALQGEDRLGRFVTRLQLGSRPPIGWTWAQRLPPVSSALSRRQAPYLDDGIIERRGAWWEVVSRGTARWGLVDARSTDRRWMLAAVQSLAPATRIVIGTDTASGPAFSWLGSRVLKVLDLSHPHPRVARELMIADAEANGFDLDQYDDAVITDAMTEAVEEELQLADAVLVASQFSASSLVGRTSAAVHVVPYGMPLGSSPPEAAPPSIGALRLCFVGALSERKGISSLLRAMTRLGGSVHLDVVGRPAGRYRLPEHLPGNVTYHAAASSAEVKAVLGRADHLVLPSMCEGFGRVLVEALAAGTGVLATERSGAPDLAALLPGAPIAVLPCDDRDRLHEAISSLRKAGPDRADVARRTRELFDLGAYGRRLVDALPPPS